MKNSNYAILLLVSAAGCGGTSLEEICSWEPPGIPCDPTAASAASLASFDSDETLCVGLQIDDDAFSELAAQHRFTEKADAMAAFEVLITHMTDSCTSNPPNLFTWFEADVQANGLFAARVGIRKKGFLGSVDGIGLCRPSLKIKTDKWVDGQTLDGTERLTLNNGAQDWLRFRTCLAYEVFSSAGYPAPLCQLANVMLNGRPMGPYTRVEPIKKRFLRRVFGNDTGSLYEATVADFTEEHLAVAASGDLGRWEAKTDETDPLGGPLLRVLAALRAPDGDLEEALAPVLDLERFITFWALETLIAHPDGYTGNRNNFHVYFDPDDGGRATFIPWGADATLGGNEVEHGLDTYVFAELPRRLSGVPALAERYRAELRRLLDEHWIEAELRARIDAYAGLLRAARVGDPTAAVESLAAFVNGRRQQIEQMLAAGPAVGSPEPCSCFEFPIGPPAIPELTEVFSAYGSAW